MDELMKKTLLKCQITLERAFR